MHKAILSVRSLVGDYTSVIEADDVNLFHARIVGAVEGITLAGAVVSGISFDVSDLTPREVSA